MSKKIYDAAGRLLSSSGLPLAPFSEWHTFGVKDSRTHGPASYRYLPDIGESGNAIPYVEIDWVSTPRGGWWQLVSWRALDLFGGGHSSSHGWWDGERFAGGGMAKKFGTAIDAYKELQGSGLFDPYKARRLPKAKNPYEPRRDVLRMGKYGDYRLSKVRKSAGPSPAQIKLNEEWIEESLRLYGGIRAMPDGWKPKTKNPGKPSASKISKAVEEFRQFCISKGDSYAEATKQAEAYRRDIQSGAHKIRNPHSRASSAQAKTFWWVIYGNRTERWASYKSFGSFDKAVAFYTKDAHVREINETRGGFILTSKKKLSRSAFLDGFKKAYPDIEVSS